MFCRSITWFICTFVAVPIATGYSGLDSTTELSTKEPVQKIKTNTGVELGAGDGGLMSLAAGDARVATLAARSPESPAQTSSAATAASGTSPYSATQPHNNSSGHSNHQTPVTAIPTTATLTITLTVGDYMSLLRCLSPKEKGQRLIETAIQGAVLEMEVLLAVGADVGARDWRNETALHWAAYNGHVEAARRLLAAGAAVDARASDRWTPLHVAADRGHVAVVRLLLANGADHGARTVSGDTPLHWAALRGQRQAAAALLEAGADRGARNNWGQTALDIARRNSDQQLVELLQRGSGLQRQD